MEQKATDTAVFADEACDAPMAVAPGEIVIGTVTGIDPHGHPLVSYAGTPPTGARVAMSTIGLTSMHIGRSVALLFVHGDPTRPVVMGLIHSPLQDLILAYQAKESDSSVDARPVDAESAPSAQNIAEVTVDGRRVVLEGKDEVVLRCGEASITLTRAGKILIRGKYLLNRSSGVNRILGGSVQIN